MNYRLAIALPLLALSLNSYAMSQITSDKVTMSRGASGGVQIKEQRFFNLSDAEKNDVTKELKATAHDVHGKIGTAVSLTTNHSVIVKNASSQKVYVSFKFSLAAAGEDIHRTETLLLEAGTGYQEKSNLYMNHFPRASGRFAITAYTSLIVDSQATAVKDDKTLTIDP